MGPFDPPADYSIEPEFKAKRPRPITAQLRRGGYERRWRTGLFVSLVVALEFWLMAQSEWVDRLSYYILPLGYVKEASWVLAGAAALLWIYHLVSTGRYKYVKLGHPFVARVLHVFLRFKGVAENPSVHYYAALEYLHPVSGRKEFAIAESPTIHEKITLSKYEVALEPGDYATAVYLTDPQRDTQLYGFTFLNPAVNFFRKNASRWNMGFR